ncbi:hypothetical protein [Aeoliella sp.]|uniref:hypothetical protein n=1 Tax=Aeoliella sp. TaxID=2795800 RepID=UPI003CCC2571
MPRPLVIAHHLIWTVYGTWLPNDPRGSGSKTIESDLLSELGELHYGRKQIQPPYREVREFYHKATPRLSHPVIRFSASAIHSAACGLAETIAEHKYTCYACAVMPDHVHMVIRKHKHQAEEMLANLKRLSRERLVSEGYFENDHPVWTAGDGWKVFLEHPDDIRRTISYVQRNPTKSGLPIQRWDFTTDYDGWPLHPGHSPNSPYARALRGAGKYPG